MEVDHFGHATFLGQLFNILGFCLLAHCIHGDRTKEATCALFQIRQLNLPRSEDFSVQEHIFDWGPCGDCDIHLHSHDKRTVSDHCAKVEILHAFHQSH